MANAPQPGEDDEAGHAEAGWLKALSVSQRGPRMAANDNRVPLPKLVRKALYWLIPVGAALVFAAILAGS